MGIGIVSMIGVVGLWSITYVFVKIALKVVDPYTLAFLRLAQGVLFLSLLYRVRGGTWRNLFRKEKWLLIGGLASAVNYIFLVISLSYTTASAGGLVVQFQFVTLAILSGLILRERFSVLKIAGIVTIAGGVVLVFSTRGAFQDVLSGRYILGNSVMLISALGWGVYALANKALSNRMSSLEILIPILMIGACVSAIPVFARFELKSLPSITETLAIVVLGVFCTGVTNALLVVGLKRLSASAAGAMTGATPLLNMYVAHWLLEEKLAPLMFISAALIIFGILGLVYSEWRGKSAPNINLKEASKPGGIEK
jgi:drug/metabolite transporter (DMT)-like permease